MSNVLETISKIYEKCQKVQLQNIYTKGSTNFGIYIWSLKKVYRKPMSNVLKNIFESFIKDEKCQKVQLQNIHLKLGQIFK